MKIREKTNRIIIHHSLSGDVGVETIREWHKERGWSDIGYHYVIRFDGTVEEARHRDLIGSHAKGRNSDSLGICVVGNFNEHTPTDEQYVSLWNLVVAIRKSYGDIPVEYHHEGCPAKLFDRDFLRWAHR